MEPMLWLLHSLLAMLDQIVAFSSLFIGSATAAAVLSSNDASKSAFRNTTQTFYPSLNDTSYISDSAIGTYGGTYTAEAEAASSGKPYGIYDYCSMPHPRADSYSLPAALSSGNQTGQLVFLEYMQRHQRRTPYNILPGGENQPYDCDSIYPYLYGGPESAPVQSMPVYGKTYTDPTNPFNKDYVNTTCQFPQLTIGGLLDGYQHGTDLKGVYGDLLGLIPATPDDSAWFRSSESALTQQSAGGVLRGVWPTYRGALPLHQQAESVDTVNEGYTCAKIDTLLSNITSTDEWNKHLNVTAALRSKLGSMFNASDSTSEWQETFDHFADNFQARLCNGYDLPCNVQDLSQCATTADADEVFRAGDWEWNYYWRANPYVKEYIQVVEGLFIGEVVAHLQAVANGTSSLKYSHSFVHDGDIGPVLGALGVNTLRWPGMGSNIAFEIWQTTSDNALYARVLYSGHPVETIHGTLDWIPIAQLIGILEPYVPTDIVALCNS